MKIMLKKYIAGTNVCFNINYKGGQKRVSFDANTGGTSSYFTRDEEEQKGIEAHRWFGDMVYLAEEIDEEKRRAELEAKAQQLAEAEKTGTKRTKEVSSIADAKDYLANLTGVSRTKMRDKASIIKVAEENNIELIWK